MQTRLDKKSILITWVAHQLIKQNINIDDYEYPEINIHKVKPTSPIRTLGDYPQISVGLTHNPIILYKRESGHFCFREYQINKDGYAVTYTLMNQLDLFLHKKIK